jgi:hypothetical protein
MYQMIYTFLHLLQSETPILLFIYLFKDCGVNYIIYVYY